MNRNRFFPFFAVPAAVLFLLLASNRCTFKKPVTPSWDVRFQLPLFDSTYTMRNLAEHNNKNLSIDPARDEVVYQIDKEIEPFPVGGYLTANGAGNHNQLEFSGHAEPGVHKPLDSTLVMQEDILVEEAVFDSGYIDIEFLNYSGYTLESYIEIPAITMADSKVFSDTCNISPGKPGLPEKRKKSVYLSGATFKPTIDGNRNLIPYKGTLTVISGDSTGNDKVTMNIDLSHLSYRSVSGWLNEVNVGIHKSLDIGIKESDKFGAIQVESAQMTLTLTNGVQFPATFDVNVSGTGDNGLSDSVRVQGSVGASGTSTIGPVEIADIINLWPKTLGINGNAKLGDGHTKADVSKNDSIRAHMYVKVPLIFSLPDTTIETDVDTIKIEKDASEKIQKNLLDAKLVFEIENHLPLGIRIEALFSRTWGDKSIYTRIDTNAVGDLIRFFEIPATTPSGTPGLVGAPAYITFSIGLSRDDLKVFEGPRVFWGLRLIFPGTAGKLVKVRPDDYLRIRTRIDATIHTDFEDKDDKKGGGS